MLEMEGKASKPRTGGHATFRRLIVELSMAPFRLGQEVVVLLQRRLSPKLAPDITCPTEFSIVRPLAGASNGKLIV